MDSLTPFLQNVTGGLLIGGIYALIGVGLSLIFGVMRIINFAHGEFVAIGMYLAMVLFRQLGIDPYLTLFIALPVGLVVGGLIQRLVLARLVDSPGDSTLLATLGLSLVIANTLFLLFGAEPQSIFLEYATATVTVAGIRLPIAQLIAGGITLAIIVALWLLLNRTEIGRAVRATAQNRLGAELVGVNTRSIHALVFGVGMALAMAAGIILAPLLFAIPTVGSSYTLKAFVVTVLGGLGSIPGAIGGGLLLGLVEFLGASYLSSGYRDAYGLFAFLLILVLRPEGLFGRSVKRV
ncbi:MAG TPA: branched-chain amino acid ABC transporter permease [Trueperaceae bacterium]|nr:branched-chain amino acid ABC transporter permease [Trueperaceae bacterium]